MNRTSVVSAIEAVSVAGFGRVRGDIDEGGTNTVLSVVSVAVPIEAASGPPGRADVLVTGKVVVCPPGVTGVITLVVLVRRAELPTLNELGGGDSVAADVLVNRLDDSAEPDA